MPHLGAWKRTLAGGDGHGVERGPRGVHLHRRGLARQLNPLGGALPVRLLPRLLLLYKQKGIKVSEGVIESRRVTAGPAFSRASCFCGGTHPPKVSEGV